LATASKIDKPYIYTKYFPLPLDKYITIHGFTEMDSRNYSYYQDVIDCLYEPLKNAGYTILQLGGKEEQSLKRVVDLSKKTTISQTAYILKGSSLHIGADTFTAHVAGHFNIPSVILYSNNLPEVCAPYWKSSRSILIISDKKGKKATFSAVENPKTINTILPETIANSALTLLNLKERVNIETLFIGKKYQEQIIELIPDQVVSLEGYTGTPTIRADYYYNENFILNQLSQRKCNLVIEQPIKVNILRQLRQNLGLIAISIDSIDIFNFVKEIKASGLQYALYSEKTGDELNNLKLKYLDFNPIITKSKSKKSEMSNLEKITEKTLFKVRRLILSNGKIYTSIAHWKDGEPIENIENPISKIKLNNDLFWEELEGFYIYNEKPNRSPDSSGKI
jgi:hypothetical protein